MTEKELQIEVGKLREKLGEPVMEESANITRARIIIDQLNTSLNPGK